MKKFQINFFTGCLLLVTGVCIRLFSTNYLLASIFIALSIAEMTIGIVSYLKWRRMNS